MYVCFVFGCKNQIHSTWEIGGGGAGGWKEETRVETFIKASPNRDPTCRILVAGE